MDRLVTLVQRLVALAIGGVFLWGQIYLIEQAYASNTTLRIVVPAFSFLLAVCPSWCHRSFKEGRWFLSTLCTFVCALVFMGNLIATLARVDDFRAGKGATADAVRRELEDAETALQRAESSEAEAASSVAKFCAATTTQQTVTGSGKKKSYTAAKVTDARCADWTGQLAARQEVTAAVRTAKGKIVIPDVDADTKRLAARLHLSPDTVEQWQPAIMPVLLEFSMMLAFSFAFRPLTYTVDEPRVARDTAVLPDNVIAFEPRDCLIMSQQVVNGLVAKWIEDEGLPVDMPIGQACEKFNAYLKRQRIVNVKLFGKALTDLGVPKRKKGGYTLIAAPDRRRRSTT